MARASFYNVAAQAIIVDSIAGNDFGDEFGYRFTPPDSSAEVTVGLDSASTSLGSNKTGTLEIAYKPTSNTLDQIYLLWQNQTKGQGRLVTISINTGVDEVQTYTGCAVKNPGISEGGGQVMVPRVATFTVQEWVPDQSLYI